MPRYNGVEDQLLRKSTPEPNSGCWLWTGFVNPFGYAVVTIDRGVTVRAHRVSYELWNGPISDGQHVLHRCDVRSCINPAHLFLGTNADNVADKVAKGRQSKGCGTGRAKLTENEVAAVRAAEGTTRAIAARFGIGKSQAHLIRSGQAWRHLP